MKKLLLLLFCFTITFASAQSSITWTMGMNIAANSYGNLHPRISTDAAGHPLVIWGRMTDQSVFISRWNGTAFTTPMKINPAWLNIATASWMGPDITSKGDTVYVVMKRTPEASDSNHIYIARSFDGGITFAAPVQVDFIADSISRFPTVTTDDNGNPLVGFMKFDPGFGNARWAVTKSSDLGNTFTTDLKASGWSGPGAAVCDCCPGAILTSDNTVTMLYRDNLGNVRDMWAGISTDGGNSFSQGIPIDQGNWMLSMCPSSGPDGTIFGDTLYSVYMSGTTGTNLVYLSKSGISSLTGSVGNMLTGMFPGLTVQNYPRIANSQNALAVVWKQSVNGSDELALKFTSNIAAGLPVAYDTVDLGNVTNADVALTNGNIFVVWEDDNSGTVKYRHGTFTSTTDIAENSSQEVISVHPNPVNSMLSINSRIPGKTTITVYNLIGAEVFNYTVNMQEEKKLDFSSRPPGIYFLKIANKNYSENIKIIKE